MNSKQLPAVGGRTMDRTIAMFEQACLVHLAKEQEKIRPDNGLIAVLCDAVRLGREYCDSRGTFHHNVLVAARNVGTILCNCDGRGCTICNLDYELNRLRDWDR